MLGARMVLVFVTLLTLSPCPDGAPATPFECCFNFAKAPVRFRVLKGFYSTPSGCYYPAIVFETRNGTKVCAEPGAKWVKNAISRLQRREGTPAPTTSSRCCS